MFAESLAQNKIYIKINKLYFILKINKKEENCTSKWYEKNCTLESALSCVNCE